MLLSLICSISCTAICWLADIYHNSLASSKYKHSIPCLMLEVANHYHNPCFDVSSSSRNMAGTLLGGKTPCSV
jgi:hypothetical protein